MDLSARGSHRSVVFHVATADQDAAATSADSVGGRTFDSATETGFAGITGIAAPDVSQVRSDLAARPSHRYVVTDKFTDRSMRNRQNHREPTLSRQA